MFENLKEIFPGLENMGPQLKAELQRLGTQGTMELASGLFNGNAFVPYGPGQYTPSAEQSHGVHGPEASLTGQEPQQPGQDQALEGQGKDQAQHAGHELGRDSQSRGR